MVIHLVFLAILKCLGTNIHSNQIKFIAAKFIFVIFIFLVLGSLYFEIDLIKKYDIHSITVKIEWHLWQLIGHPILSVIELSAHMPTEFIPLIVSFLFF